MCSKVLTIMKSRVLGSPETAYQGEFRSRVRARRVSFRQGGVVSVIEHLKFEFSKSSGFNLIFSAQPTNNYVILVQTAAGLGFMLRAATGRTHHQLSTRSILHQNRGHLRQHTKVDV